MPTSIYHDTLLSAQVIKGDADNETLTGAGVDMLGYGGAVFIAEVQANEVANYDLKVQQASASDFSDAADLAGSKVTFATSTTAKGVAMVEVRRPTKRYLRPLLVCANVTTGKGASVVALQYGNEYRPETGNTGKFLLSPAEGTA